MRLVGQRNRDSFCGALSPRPTAGRSDFTSAAGGEDQGPWLTLL
ncbi:MAG TPA: hypothetical protein VIJ66_12190 [Solirubrobacteraceae bacterium]